MIDYTVVNVCPSICIKFLEGRNHISAILFYVSLMTSWVICLEKAFNKHLWIPVFGWNCPESDELTALSKNLLDKQIFFIQNSLLFSGLNMSLGWIANQSLLKHITSSLLDLRKKKLDFFPLIMISLALVNISWLLQRNKTWSTICRLAQAAHIPNRLYVIRLGLYKQ